MAYQPLKCLCQVRFATMRCDGAKLAQRVLRNGFSDTGSCRRSRMQIRAYPNPYLAQVGAPLPHCGEQTRRLLAQQCGLRGAAGRYDQRIVFDGQHLDREPQAAGIQLALQSSKPCHALSELSKIGLLVQPFDG